MASAAATPKEEVVQTIGWGGGLNIRDSPVTLAQDEARVMENGVLDEKGAFAKRLGCVSKGTFGVAANRILSIYTYYRGATAPQVLIHTTAGTVYYTNDPTVASVVWTQIATGLSTTAPMSFETFNGKCYFSNGVDAYASWDGTTYTTFASAPKGKFLRLWKDTMWVSGVTGLPDRVYSSNAGNAEVFGVSAWVDLGKGDGDQVTALSTDGTYLIVFKRERHFIVYDPGLFSNRVVDYEKGCESHFSVIQFESQIYFLSRRGICKYLGDTPAAFISGKVDPLFNPAILNLGALTNAWAYSTGNQIGWALPELGSTVPTIQLEYYPRLGVIGPFGNIGIGPFVFHRMPANCFTKYRWAGNEILYAGKTTENKLLQLFATVGADDGATFSAFLETAFRDLGTPVQTKYIRTLRFLGRGRVTAQLKREFQISSYKTWNLDLTSQADLWGGTDKWGVGNWGPDSPVKEELVNPDAYGRYFALRFTDASTATSVRLVPVGSQGVSLIQGEWAIYSVVANAYILGVRD